MSKLSQIFLAIVRERYTAVEIVDEECSNCKEVTPQKKQRDGKFISMTCTKCFNYRSFLNKDLL